MSTFTRRHLLQGLGASLLIPQTALAAKDSPSQQILQENILASERDLLAYRQRFGAWIHAASRPLRNCVTGESAVFLYPKNGFASWLYTAEPGAFVPFAHRHTQNEIYEVLSGRLKVLIDGKEHEVSSGDRLVIPSMSMHEAWNPFSELAEVMVSFDPNSADVQRMSELYWTACDLGYINEEGAPEFLKVLPVFRTVESRAYPEGMPKFLVDLFL